MSVQDPSSLVRLVVEGQEYGGWKSVRIEAGIERQARSFDLEVTDKWPGQTDIPRRIRPFDTCQLYIGDDLVLTGYVDGTPIQYDATSVGVGVRGRSKTADLVDCCPIEAGKSSSAAKPAGGNWSNVIGADDTKGTPVTPPAKTANQWSNAKLETIAAALAAPYGVRVVTEVDTGRVISDHQIQPGETVFESIDRMMRQRHVLSTDNARGDLVFIDVGSTGRAVTALELGKNVLSGSADLDYSGVFSEYVVKGQRTGNDEEFGQAVAEQEASASDAMDDGGEAITRDSRARRRRVLVIRQSGQADEGTCADRAKYEKAYRSAKALESSYVVNGWRQENGQLWLPNLLVQVRDPVIGFDMEMVIAECAWIMDAEGLRTELKVGPVDGYQSKAAKPGKAAKKGKGGSSGPYWSDVKR